MHETTPQRNDPVFQLSLTELAFTVAFVLLLLAGVLVAKAERERDAVRQEMNEPRDELAQAAKEAALNAIWTQMRQEMARGAVPNLDERLSDLVRGVEAQADAAGLQARIDALTTRLVALEALQGTLERSSPVHRDEAAGDLMERGIAALRGLESVTREPIPSAKAFDTAAKLAADARRARELVAENAHLKGQMAHVRRQVAGGEAKGFGLPPCWVDASGRIQRLIDVTITDAGLIARPAWPAERAADAAAIPGAAALMGQRAVDVSAFVEQAREVYEWSRNRDPECRHYAQVIVAASRVEAAVRGKNAVYALFYPAGPELLEIGSQAPVRISAP